MTTIIAPATMDGSPFTPASLWQQGCDDAKAGRGPNPPQVDPVMRGLARERYLQQMVRRGYVNGYLFGCDLAGRQRPPLNPWGAR